MDATLSYRKDRPELDCNVCGQTKPAAEFYRRVMSRCKECHKAAAKERYAHLMANDPAWVRTERARNREKMKGKKSSRALTAEELREYRRRNPAKYKARQAVGHALRAGAMKKPESCQRCGVESQRLQGHHEDYSKPLDVLWLCTSCHGFIHRLDQEVA